MEQELRYLGHALESPERPFVAILGGAKVSDKIEVIENLLGKVDRLLIGGAMAYTFFKSRGLPVGKSLVEDDKLDAARAHSRGCRGEARRRLELPVDHVVAPKLEAGAPHEVLAVGDPAHRRPAGPRHRPGDDRGLRRRARRREDVVWNGPMGVFEIAAFAAGTNRRRARGGGGQGTTIIGGGDSIAAVKKAGVADRITHISTGGGASLEFLGGRMLPGVAALEREVAMPLTHAIHRRQLEDVQDRARGGRLRQGAAERRQGRQRRRIVVAPPFTAIHAVAEARAEHEHRRRGAGSPLGARGRVHRRGQRRR